MGKVLLLVGAFLMAIGGLLWFFERFSWEWPRLPGDIVIERPSFRLYIPLGTSVLLSVLLSGLFYLLSRWLRS
ncbi:MAG: hypothetical protein KatS3mg025_0223 [Bacteroidia bacterium]|nr:MAG: hypothetical protein KatS3mg025_0223 [Bacteroidia bacterium]